MEASNCLYLTSAEDTLFDPNYRYKIQKPIFRNAFYKGKPITIFENLTTFAQELYFDSEILLKVIASKLSCSSGKQKQDNFYYFCGHYDNQTITNIICEFIQKYLLCSACDRPEVVLKYKKGQLVQKCKACGHVGAIQSCDKIADLLVKHYK